MKSKRVDKACLLILFCFTILFSGCTNLAAVRTFADETKKLTEAFNPMLAGATSSCIEKFKRKKLLTSRTFEPENAEEKAKILCGPIDEDNKTIADLNSLLEQYADTLLSLADEKLPTYKPELDGLKDSLTKVKKPGTQTDLIESKKLAAISSLTEFLSRVATQHLQKKAIRELINHEDAINVIAEALEQYATLNYKAWLNDEQKEIISLRKSLEQYSETENLAANYQKTLLLTEERQIKARGEAVDAFVKSVSEFKKSNAELRAKFEQSDNKELLIQLHNYAKEVANLRKQINEAF